MCTEAPQRVLAGLRPRVRPAGPGGRRTVAVTRCARFRISLLGDFVYEVYEQAGDRQCFSADFDLPQVLDWPTDSQDEYVWAIQRVVEHRLRPDLARPFFRVTAVTTRRTLEWWAGRTRPGCARALLLRLFLFLLAPLGQEAPDKGRVLTSGAAVHGEACEESGAQSGFAGACAAENSTVRTTPALSGSRRRGIFGMKRGGCAYMYIYIYIYISHSFWIDSRLCFYNKLT